MRDSLNKLLLEAVNGDDIDMVKNCVLRGVAPDQSVEDTRGERMSLHWLAFKEGHMKSFEFLVRAGASIETANSSGYTFLLAAADERSVDKMKKCMELGADITASTRTGVTVLDLVMRWSQGHDRKETIDMILKEIPIVRDDPEAVFNKAAAPVDTTIKGGVRAVERIRLTPLPEKGAPGLDP